MYTLILSSSKLIEGDIDKDNKNIFLPIYSISNHDNNSLCIMLRSDRGMIILCISYIIDSENLYQIIGSVKYGSIPFFCILVVYTEDIFLREFSFTSLLDRIWTYDKMMVFAWMHDGDERVEMDKNEKV